MDTLFQVPTNPEEFGVALQPAQLRRLNFSALDYGTLRRAGIEYVNTYFSDIFNDFVAANGFIMFLETASYIGGNLSQRSDILAEEAFLPTARTRIAVQNHLTLIDQTIRRQTPANVDIECTITNPIPTAINIPPGLTFSTTGSDGAPVIYELYRTPGDFISPITIQPGRRGVIGFGLEGQFAADFVVESSGGPDQTIPIIATDILDDPVIVTVTTGSTDVQWSRVDNIARSDPNDEVYEIRLIEDGIEIVFGDDIAGKAPLAGQIITVRYRIGGGIRGRIGRLVINESRPVAPEPPLAASQEVLFRNLNPSSGGQDEETLEAAKRRAPREAATRGAATSGEDYAQRASTFAHPVYGSVLKAVATIRTGIEADINAVVEMIQQAASVEEGVEILQTNFVNRNIVELHVLAEGPDGVPVTPSLGLRQGLVTFFESIAPLTDEIRVLPGAIKQVDFEATIAVSRTADAPSIKEQVNTVVDDFFSTDNFDLGEPLYRSNLIRELQDIPGVAFVDLFQPEDDIIPTGDLASATSPGVGKNELITLGQKEIKIFFEKAQS